ncbi:MAG: hypothetical protein ACRD3G_27530, partial [Vicinamibacterales bacterium]
MKEDYRKRRQQQERGADERPGEQEADDRENSTGKTEQPADAPEWNSARHPAAGFSDKITRVAKHHSSTTNTVFASTEAPSLTRTSAIVPL